MNNKNKKINFEENFTHSTSSGVICPYCDSEQHIEDCDILRKDEEEEIRKCQDCNKIFMNQCIVTTEWRTYKRKRNQVND